MARCFPYVFYIFATGMVECALNLARGKYIKDLGNTPGHLQHWSKKSFITLVEKYFTVIEVKSPLPWTMLLCRQRQG